MQDLYAILTPSYALDPKVGQVLAQRFREVRFTLESGEGAQGIYAFRERHLGGRLHQESWGLATITSTCWNS